MKMAVDAGLDFAIANPYESWEGADSYAIALLENKDAGAKNYIQKYANLPRPAPQASTDSIKTLDEKLYESVLYGDAQSADEHAAQIIKTNDRPFERINEAVLKALNFVGDKFASKEYFLPQIIMSAQSAQRAFSRVKESLPRLASENKKTVILATVKGDMHDIGKNIVGAVLESYGFTVKDLGISVEADEIINEAIKIKPIAIGLSALMTTTMPEMEVVVKLRDNKNLNVPVIVGGAAVTQKFADEIKADFYARDAVETAKIVSKINEQAGS
jgi:5-methyltetrahydrofolate--homocysteine methyltransferase